MGGGAQFRITFLLVVPYNSRGHTPRIFLWVKDVEGVEWALTSCASLISSCLGGALGGQVEKTAFGTI